MAVFVLFGLALSAGVGWLLFRRMLMPTETRLKPSGARPWSRTRVPNPDSQAGQMNMGMLAANAVAAGTPDFGQMNNGYAQHSPDPTMQNGYPQHNPDPTMQNGYPQHGFDPIMQNGYPQHSPDPTMQNGYPQHSPDPTMQNGYPQYGFDPNMQNGYAQHGFNPNMQNGYPQPGVNGYGQVSGGFHTPATGFNSFSDSFVPPSPQIFSPSDTSMIPPNTSILATFGNNKGYAPNSNAFNALYGLPDDPFASSQSGGSGWLDTLGSGQNVGGQAPNSFGGGEPNTNDPYLAEIIRQYSQKGQTGQQPQAPRPQQRPGSPNSDWAK